MSADMTDLFQAIYTRYARFKSPVSPHTLTGGRLFRTQAPAGVQAPYIVITQIGGSINEMFSHDALEEVMAQMSVFGEFNNDMAPTSQIMQGLITIFNWCILHIPGAETYIRMRREGMQHEIVDDMIYAHIWQDWVIEKQVPADFTFTT